jgi:hypothetical protein
MKLFDEILQCPDDQGWANPNISRTKNIVEIAEKFAIGFALWKETIMQDENGLYFSESRAQISRNNPVNIQKLLEAYKKQPE